MDFLAVDKIIRFHKRLNPRLWQPQHRLRTEVRLKILENSIAFYRFLDVKGLIVSDIILTGSNAAYNYTLQSDLDVHLLVDFSRTPCPDMASNMFITKKTLWNQSYNITINDHPLELYVENTADPVNAKGVFSVLHNRWLKIPSRTPPSYDDVAILTKAEVYAAEIDALLAGESTIAMIDEMLHRLYHLRQNGLMSGGEFSAENLTYKTLRAIGYLQKLYDERTKLHDQRLSVHHIKSL
jgi:hypothetical protein